ncbi:DUF1232 domain-containing protein [Aequoribacter fuscus]|nr:DUF1232 domain-containing protein [Aequoribacter fuscus]
MTDTFVKIGNCQIKSGLLHLISFIDAIPDLTPVFGYTDDIALIALAAKSLYDVIDEDVKAQARETTASLLD